MARAKVLSDTQVPSARGAASGLGGARERVVCSSSARAAAAAAAAKGTERESRMRTRMSTVMLQMLTCN